MKTRVTTVNRAARHNLDRRVAGGRPLRDTLLGVALFSGLILVSGVLAIAFIALMQALGFWAPTTPETTIFSPEGTEELRSSIRVIVHRHVAPHSEA